ncbi:unnamed protein product [Diamesa serratosioi]
MSKWIALSIIVLLVGIYVYPCKVQITIENGPIGGEKRGNFYAYEGIPYAEPVVGENRFEAPKPFTEKWNEKREFIKYGSPCIQWDHFPERIVHGEEDCLTLNVYVPETLVDAKDPVPVLFYIHGGAFMFGGSFFYGPQNIMNAQNVILVTINYRLGILGFLSTEDEALPGNFGMKDQVAALKWVNRNIKAFNGDPNKVTISGFSAGGASVHLFYMSELTNGLFQNGISTSGVALNPWVMCENAREKAHKVASLVNCPTHNHKRMVKCLKNTPAEELVKQATKFQPFLYNPFSPFGVVVEKPCDTAFLTDHPRNILKNKKTKNLPWIASVVQDEGLYPAAEWYKEIHLKTIDEKWDDLAISLLDFNGTTVDYNNKVVMAQKIRKFYLQDKKISKKTFFQLRNMMSDRLFNYDFIKAIQLQSEVSPTYYYHFQYKSLSGIGEAMSGSSDKLGIAHGEDNFLIFDTKTRDLSEEELTMSKNLIDLFSTFARENIAIYENTKLVQVQSGNVKALEIFGPGNVKISDKNSFGNVKFWDSLSIND